MQIIFIIAERPKLVIPTERAQESGALDIIDRLIVHRYDGGDPRYQIMINHNNDSLPIFINLCPSIVGAFLLKGELSINDAISCIMFHQL